MHYLYKLQFALRIGQTCPTLSNNQTYGQTCPYVWLLDSVGWYCDISAAIWYYFWWYQYTGVQDAFGYNNTTSTMVLLFSICS